MSNLQWHPLRICVAQNVTAYKYILTSCVFTHCWNVEPGVARCGWAGWTSGEELNLGKIVWLWIFGSPRLDTLHGGLRWCVIWGCSWTYSSCSRSRWQVWLGDLFTNSSSESVVFFFGLGHLIAAMWSTWGCPQKPSRNFSWSRIEQHLQ